MICDSVIPDSIAAGRYLSAEPLARHMKRKMDPGRRWLADEAQT
jgi:hypothetical protein